MKKIDTNKAPKAIGPYSQAIVINNIIYTSGQLGINPETGLFAGNKIEDQTHQAIKNIIAILEEANTSIENVIKTTVFVKDINDFGKINEIYAKYFINSPARSLVEVSRLPKDGLIEIEAVAKI
ncbi:MAG: RidA family protein [Acholeplasmatales bacterium]|nr:RidA family protein [Acholeplasmatales bacterium]